MKKQLSHAQKYKLSCPTCPRQVKTLNTCKKRIYDDFRTRPRTCPRNCQTCPTCPKL